MWYDYLQSIYNDLEEFSDYCDLYNLHKRLGYDLPKDAWEANPFVQGSTVPDDYRALKDWTTDDCIRFLESDLGIDCGGIDIPYSEVERWRKEVEWHLTK